MTVEQRLSRIEKSNQKLRLMCAALALAFTATFIFAAERDRTAVQDVVRAKSFEVIGKNGTVVGSMWATTDGSGGLFLSSKPGHPYFTVWCISDEIARLNLHGPENQRVAHNNTGGVHLLASDKDGANISVYRGNDSRSGATLSAEEAGGQIRTDAKAGEYVWPQPH